ncbi:MAG: M48 family metallopeptidase [Frankia sp.]
MRLVAPLLDGCPDDGLVALVADLAARAGVAAPDTRVAPTAGIAYVRSRRSRVVLVLDPSVREAGPGVLRGVVAHELGHLAAGHQADARRRLLTMVAAAALGGAGAFAVARSPLVAASVALLVSACGLLIVLAALRRHELAADAAAVGLLGGPDSTLETLTWLEAAHPGAGRRPGRLARWGRLDRLGRLLDDHPTRVARKVAVERHPVAQVRPSAPTRPGAGGAVADVTGAAGVIGASHASRPPPRGEVLTIGVVPPG